MNRIMCVAAALALASCAAEAATSEEYQAAVECEMSVGTLAAFDSSLSRASVAKYHSYHLAAVERTGALADRIGKSSGEIEDDRKAFLERLAALPGQEALELSRGIAAGCLAA